MYIIINWKVHVAVMLHEAPVGALIEISGSTSSPQPRPKSSTIAKVLVCRDWVYSDTGLGNA